MHLIYPKPAIFCRPAMDQNADLWKHCLEYAALSDLGLRRSNNQDSLAVVIAGGQAAWQQRGHLFMVADGMGAHAAGELASKMAVDCVPLTYQKMLDAPPPEALRHAIADANQQIHDRGQASDDFRGMGTTASTLVLLPQGAVVAHVGDSRVYRLRGQRFEQLTFDHSLVWEMSAAGNMPEDEVPDYVPKNIITRSLGPNAEVEVDLEGPFPLEMGDTFLLCSDGLSGQVRDEEIGTDPRLHAAGGRGPVAGRSGQSPRRTRQHHGDRRPSDRPPGRQAGRPAQWQASFRGSAGASAVLVAAGVARPGDDRVDRSGSVGGGDRLVDWDDICRAGGASAAAVAGVAHDTTLAISHWARGRTGLSAARPTASSSSDLPRSSSNSGTKRREMIGRSIGITSTRFGPRQTRRRSHRATPRQFAYIATL